MAESQSLEERLQRHNGAFEALLTLIPAKQYYLGDTSEQWKQKKQTKEEARAAKRAKLDPANNKSALDIIKENERKRKREEDGRGAAEDDSALEKPLEGLKVPKSTKKQKLEAKKNEATKPDDKVDPRRDKKDKKKKLKEEKKVRNETKKAQKRAEKQAEEAEDVQSSEDELGDDQEGQDADLSFLKNAELDSETNEQGDNEERKSDRDPAETDNQDSPEESSKASSPAFDFSAQPSGTSSISSTGTNGSHVPGDDAAKGSISKAKAPGSSLFNKNGTEPRLSMAEMQERLRQRIAEKRSQRNADIDGRPAKTRAELIESRRKLKEHRKATKKALRQQAKEEEVRQREEALARGSPLMSPSVRSPPHGEDSNNFTFGRVAFDNGHAMTADLSAMMDLSKRKGPSDVKTALSKADAKDARLAGLDSEKRAQTEEKDMWLNARKRAHGERVRDDSSLLKKALKRKQKQKEKSATDWKKRLDGIKAAKDAKQRKREDNLAKRKEEKGKKGSKGGKAKKPKKRPGFEGSFRAGGRK